MAKSCSGLSTEIRNRVWTRNKICGCSIRRRCFVRRCCTDELPSCRPKPKARSPFPVLGFSSGSPGYLDGAVQSRYVGSRENYGRRPIAAVCYPTYRTLACAVTFTVAPNPSPQEQWSTLPVFYDSSSLSHEGLVIFFLKGSIILD